MNWELIGYGVGFSIVGLILLSAIIQGFYAMWDGLSALFEGILFPITDTFRRITYPIYAKYFEEKAMRKILEKDKKLQAKKAALLAKNPRKYRLKYPENHFIDQYR